MIANYSAANSLLTRARMQEIQMKLAVRLYAYALGISSARLVEDLAFRYLATGKRVDDWALSAIRHRLALNDAFTQVRERVQSQGTRKLRRVAINSTRLAASYSEDRVDTEQAPRDKRAPFRGLTGVVGV